MTKSLAIYGFVRMMFMIVLSIGAVSCTDEFHDITGGQCPDGEPARVRVCIDTGNMDEFTRSDMQEGLDRSVTDLWVAVYNVSSGARTGLTRLDDLDENLMHDYRSVDVDALSGESYIVGVANISHRFASVDASGELISLSDALDQADTWEKFRAISVAFDSEGGCVTDAPLNALVMSGTFTSASHSSGNMTGNNTVAIFPGMSAPSGAVHLRRLISQVRFNISYDKKNVRSFDVKSWKVVNVPVHTWLLERDGGAFVNAPDERTAAGNSYHTTPVMSDLTVTDDTWSFDFWQLENKRTGRPVPSDYTQANAYSYREKEYKDDAGKNTGLFVALAGDGGTDSVDNNATYVVFSVSMEMNVDENGNSVSSAGLAHRLVETEYTVHLGYVEGSGFDRARDFNCRRNSKYTYNVRINNVNDVMVEAYGESADAEKNPAVEGFVSDITDSYYEVDAHYAAVNIYLTRDDIASFEYYITAYRLDGSEITVNSFDRATVPSKDDTDHMYVEWVELRPTSGQNVLARYRPRKGANADGQTYTLDEVKGNSSMRAGWYTMFINEYVYERSMRSMSPDDSGYGNESGSTDWHGYVNRPDRRVWINVEGVVSPDGESVYYKSKYAVSQSSIQTYYNDDTDSGLGVEHVNESLGLTLRNSFNPFRNSSGTQLNTNTTPGRNNVAGRYNLAQYIAGSAGSALSWNDNSYTWTKFIDVTAPQTVNRVNNQGVSLAARTEPLPAIRTVSVSEYGLTSTMLALEPDYGQSNRKYIEAITACLNRNRDNDGDGRIDASELRWFVPTSGQYVRMILGRRSLVHPLFDPGDMTRLPNNSGTNNGLNSSLLAYASDGKQMWLMEGTSDSEYRQWAASVAVPWQVRCVRNLGSDNTVIKSVAANNPAFELRKGTNIVDMKYYDEMSIRKEAYHSSSSPMPVHHINDQRYNRCYRSFEFFDSVIGLNDARLKLSGKTIEWSSYLSSTNPCAILGYTGKRGWRVPNQKELTILGILGVQNRNVPSGNVFQVTCSYSFFDFDGYVPGANPKDPVATGSISSAFRFPMKIVTSSGLSTQSETMNNITVNNAYFGIRCVRDVE